MLGLVVILIPVVSILNLVFFPCGLGEILDKVIDIIMKKSFSTWCVTILQTINMHQSKSAIILTQLSYYDSYAFLF